MFSPIQQHCSKRLLSLWRIYAAAAALLVLSLGLYCAILSDIAILIPSAVSVSSIMIYQIIYLPVLWNCRTYTRSRGILCIKKGCIFSRTIIVPRTQLQFISVRRHPLERILGLSTLIFHTTGGRVYLSGLEKEDALQLRENFSRGFEK